MASGPFHYQEAERLLAYVENSGPDPAHELIAAAHVHALLAFTAATADPFGSEEHWREVLS